MTSRTILVGLIVAGWTTLAHAESPVERGEYLVRGPAGCGNCHTPMGPNGFVMEEELGGRLVDDNEAFTAYAPNITPGGRIAQWSDADLKKAIREGLRPDGSLIGPPMPFAVYRGLADSDLDAIVAFLRTVPSVESQTPASVYRFPLPPAYGPPVGKVTAPERGPTAAYGAYLAGPVSHCMECHTPMGPQGPLLDTALGQGGFPFHGPWGISVASNLTSHEDGLKPYSDDEIKTMITQGLRPDGSKMFPPMPYVFLSKMTPDDLNAVVAYLRTLPPLPDKK
jgi:mono/diheme cytochrome c family protein